MWKKWFSSSQKNDDTSDKSYLEELKEHQDQLPQHVAVIMDGNGRWATGQGLIRTAGHRAGVKTLKKIVKTCTALKLNALTVYAFSTENWKRPHAEVDFLMDLFSEYLAKEIDEMDQDNVKIDFIGRTWELSKGLQKQIADARHRTRDNTGVKFTVAVNYGGQDELLRAVQEIAAQSAKGALKPDDITIDNIEQQLDTYGLPPVDLVIRTSGDMRLSNFLLWQTAYAEFWFTDTNWPDFTPEEFAKALSEFGHRDRRFGGLSAK